MTPEKRDLYEVRRHLRDLLATVEGFLSQLDGEMRQPSTLERGKRIAALCNALDMQAQIARRFGLKKRAPRPPEPTR